MKNGIRFFAVLLCCLLLLGSCSGKDRKAVAACAGQEVLYEELRFLTLTCRDRMAQKYGEDIWNSSESAEAHRAELEETVWQTLADDYVVFAAARELLPGVSISDDDIQAAANQAVQNAITEAGGKSAYKSQLKESYLTEHLMQFFFASAVLEDRLSEKLFAGTELESETKLTEWLLDGNLVRARQIYVPAESNLGHGSAVAEDLRAKLLSGEPIDSVIGEEEKKAGVLNGTPRYFVRGLTEEPILSVALSMKQAGDVSEVVDNGEGFLFFIREENDTDRLSVQISSYLSRLRDVRQKELLAGYREQAIPEKTEYGSSLDLLSIR